MWFTRNSVLVNKQQHRAFTKRTFANCIHTHRDFKLIVIVYIVTKEEFSVMMATIILNDCSIVICHVSLHLDSPSLFPLVISLLLCRH